MNTRFLIIAFTIYATIIAAVTMWTDRNMDYWVTYLKEEPTDVPYWVSFVVTFVLNGFILFLNTVAEVAKLFVE